MVLQSKSSGRNISKCKCHVAQCGGGVEQSVAVLKDGSGDGIGVTLTGTSFVSMPGGGIEK